MFFKGHKHSEETRRKMSETRKVKGIVPPNRKGICLTQEHKNRISAANKEAYSSLELRKKMSDIQKGDKAYWWKGGVTRELLAIRNSLEYKLWRESVFKRDNYTCIWCGIKGGKLNADHIKSFALFPEIRFAIDNGRTLCVNCHKTTDTFGGKSKGRNDQGTI
jgi:hypothetical protein